MSQRWVEYTGQFIRVKIVENGTALEVRLQMPIRNDEDLAEARRKANMLAAVISELAI